MCGCMHTHTHTHTCAPMHTKGSVNQSINQPMDSISYAGGCPYNNYDRYTLYIDSYVVLMCHCLKLSIHFFLGLPLPLLPSISASYTLLTSLSGPISARASLQLTCLLLTFSNTPSCLSSSLMSIFLALSTFLSLLFASTPSFLSLIMQSRKWRDSSCVR